MAKYCILLSDDFIYLTNGVDPDEMQHYAAFHLGLSCFAVCKSTSLGVSPNLKGYAHLSQGLTLCILIDFPILIDTISMELTIVYFKGSQVEFSE